MASIFEEDGQALNGYDVFVGEAPAAAIERFGDRVECGNTVLVRCTANEAIRAAALFELAGPLVHLAVEDSQYGREALAVLELALRSGR